MKGIILAGGTGSRLRPITNTMSKHLIPVANKPVLRYGLESFERAGIFEVGVVVGDQSRDAIAELCESANVKTTIIPQDAPKGVAHAVKLASDFVGDEPFVVRLGDNVTELELQELVDRFEARDETARICVQEVDSPGRYGIANFDPDGNLCEVIEKPGDPPSNLAMMGIYVFSPAIFECIDRIQPSWRDEYEITDAIQLLIETGHRVGAHHVDGWWKDVGTPDDILKANRHLLEHRSAFTNRTGNSGGGDNHVAIHPAATVADDAKIDGPVAIGKNANIGPRSHIGPYTSIGDRVTVRNSHVKNSIVMDGTVVEPGSIITDSILGTPRNG